MMHPVAGLHQKASCMPHQIKPSDKAGLLTKGADPGVEGHFIFPTPGSNGSTTSGLAAVQNRTRNLIFGFGLSAIEQIWRFWLKSAR